MIDVLVIKRFLILFFIINIILVKKLRFLVFKVEEKVKRLRILSLRRFFM